MLTRRASAVAAGLAGSALGGVFHVAARIRGGRPLHPKGATYDAVISRHGIGLRTGADWLDLPGEDWGLVRLSRAAGLPGPLPDVLGMALTFSGDGDERYDVLLATTGSSAPGRFMLVPRRDPWSVRYGSLLPYTAGGRLAVVAAVPVHGGAAGDETRVFRLEAAGLAGPWRPFGVLELRARVAAEPLRFDPRYTPPGLRWHPALVRLRQPSYAATQDVPVHATRR